MNRTQLITPAGIAREEATERFIRPLTLLLSVSALVGVAVALAESLPYPVRHFALLAALMAWLIGVLVAIISIVRRFDVAAGAEDTRWPAIFAGVGIGLTLLSAVELELIRLLQDRPWLSWNVDWRFLWAEARAIGRFGGVESALDYAGASITYHIGPSWLAGSVEHVLGGGAATILFGVVPFLCAATVAGAVIHLLYSAGCRLPIACALAGVAFAVPAIATNFSPTAPVILAHPGIILNWDLWQLGPSAIPNGLLGAAVALSSLALLCQPSPKGWMLAIGSVGLASVVEIKPQYFAGVGLVVGSIGIMRIIRPTQKDFRLLIAAIAALVLAVLMLRAGESVIGGLSVPRWQPGATAVPYAELLRELIRPHGLLAVVAFIITVRAGPLGESADQGFFRRERGRGTFELLFASFLASILLLGFLTMVEVPAHASAVLRAEAIGFSGLPGLAERGFIQAVLPLRLLVVIPSLVIIYEWVRKGPSWTRRAAFGIAGVLILLRVPALLMGWISPVSHGYEPVEDPALAAVLAEVPRDGELIVTNDIADAARDYGRTARAFILSAYFGHRFFVSSLRYGHFLEPDAAERLRMLQSFFYTPWSVLHSEWLWREGITHVLIHDRCELVWTTPWPSTLDLVAAAGDWSIYRVTTSVPSGTFDTLSQPSEVPPPRWGRSPCLGI